MRIVVRGVDLLVIKIFVCKYNICQKVYFLVTCDLSKTIDIVDNWVSIFMCTNFMGSTTFI